jgi:hypothetical protein
LGREVQLTPNGFHSTGERDRASAAPAPGILSDRHRKIRHTARKLADSPDKRDQGRLGECIDQALALQRIERRVDLKAAGC